MKIMFWKFCKNDCFFGPNYSRDEYLNWKASLLDVVWCPCFPVQGWNTIIEKWQVAKQNFLNDVP